MLNTAKTTIKFGFLFGGFHITKLLSRNSPKILMYHRFGIHNSENALGIETFDTQMKLLREHFNVMALKDFCYNLRNGIPLPQNTVVITIDDGYTDFYQYAFPVLKKYSLPATVYVTSDFIDKKIWMWWDIIAYAILNTKYTDYIIDFDKNLITYDLKNKKFLSKAINEISSFCKTLPNKEKWDYIDSIVKDLKVTLPETPAPDYAAMTWQQLIEVKQHQIEIGGHTLTHPILVNIDPRELQHELLDSKLRIEQMTDSSVEAFTYPNGTKADYNNEIKKQLMNIGYTNATVAYTDSQITDDIFALRRYPACSSDMFSFKHVIYGSAYLWNVMHSP